MVFISPSTQVSEQYLKIDLDHMCALGSQFIIHSYSHLTYGDEALLKKRRNRHAHRNSKLYVVIFLKE